MTSKYTVVTSPLQIVGLSDFQVIPEDACLDDLLPKIYKDRDQFLCSVLGPDFPEGAYIERENWHLAPRPGHAVVFHRPVLGGGNDSKVALRTILVIVAAFVFQQYYGLTGWQLAAATAVSSLAINALIPLDPGLNSQQGGRVSPTFSAAGNQARIDQPVPEIFGHQNPYPDFACPPYIDFDDEGDQYYYAILLVSEGELEILRISIDDTPIANFNGVTIARCGPGQSERGGPGTGYETLAEQGIASANMVSAIEVSNMEMTSLRFVGPFIPVKGEFTATKIYTDMLFPRGLTEGLSIVWRVDVREVNDFGQPIGAWSTLGTETYDTESAVPVRKSYGYDLTTPIRPQVRLLRTDLRSEEGTDAHDVVWGGLRVEIDGTGVDHDSATFIALRIRANEQLSGLTQSRFRVLCNRLLQTTTDGVTWGYPEATRNPAWSFAHILRSRGMTDDQIDLEQLLILAETWETRQDRFDFIFDTALTTWDALAMIARVGRAVPLLRASKVTCWRDQEEDAPIGCFGMRDIREDTFEIEFSMADSDPVDGIYLEYYDHRRWDWATVTAQYYGGVLYGYRGELNRPEDVLTGPTGAVRIRIPGIMGENQAIRTAVFHLADLTYRSIRANISTELQGLLPAYGSLVLAQHDVGDFGQSGDVSFYDTALMQIETTEPVFWTAGKKHYIRLVRPNGTVTNRILVTPAQPTPRTLQLASPPDFDVLYDKADIERTRYVFGPSDRMGAMCKVRRITPRGERMIDLQLVGEDGRVHTADNEWLPGADEQDPVSDGRTMPTDPGDFLVYLVGRLISHTIEGGDPVDQSITLTFNNDGTFEFSRDVDYEATAPADQWLIPQTVTSTVAALFEIRASVRYQSLPEGSVGDYIDGSDLDTWLGLGTTREWTFEYPLLPNSAHADTILDVQIRVAATGLVQVAAEFTLTLAHNPAFDGGPGDPGGVGDGGPDGDGTAGDGP